YALGGHRRHFPGPGACVGRNHGGGLRGRQQRAPDAVPARARDHDRGADRQRFRRGDRDLSLRPAPARLRALRRDLRGGGAGAADAGAAVAPGGQLMSGATASDGLYLRRRVTNAVALSLSCVAAAIGLAVLGWILWTLVSKGIGGINWDLFSKDTPPPMAEGGLRNALYGSAVMCGMAILMGAPLGVAAGTWLAEYGANSRIATTVRFVNDILLSAPSIVLGLFVYTLLVMHTGGSFSAIAGAVALAFIVLPVVLPTADELLRPGPWRSRAAARRVG